MQEVRDAAVTMKRKADEEAKDAGARIHVLQQQLTALQQQSTAQVSGLDTAHQELDNLAAALQVMLLAAVHMDRALCCWEVCMHSVLCTCCQACDAEHQ